MSSKTCKNCEEEKNISEFYNQRGECKFCMNKKRKVNKELSGTKKCIECDQEKDIQRFRPLRNVCKDCNNEKRKIYMKDYYEKNKKEWKEKERTRNEKLTKLQEEEQKIKECRDCKKNKLTSEFRLNRKRCKDCERKENREWVLDKRHTDPIYKFISNCRTRLVQAVRKENKKQSTIEYLGEDIDFIKEWIIFNFSDSMTWENQGSFWHIDHVIPVSRFNLETEDDVIRCFNWKNLSPLTKKENLTKSSNIIISQIKEHISNLRLFVSKYYKNKHTEVEEYITNIFSPYLTNDQ